VTALRGHLAAWLWLGVVGLSSAALAEPASDVLSRVLTQRQLELRIHYRERLYVRGPLLDAGALQGVLRDQGIPVSGEGGLGLRSGASLVSLSHWAKFQGTILTPEQLAWASSSPPVRITSATVTVKDLLDRICPQFGYRYEVYRGAIVHFMPVEALTLVHNPLNALCQGLTLTAVTAEKAFHAIRTVTGARPRMGLLYLGKLHHVQTPLPRFELPAGLTVRAALNEIVYRWDLKGYRAGIGPDPGLTGPIYISSVTFW